jgi:hypothetical protein
MDGSERCAALLIFALAMVVPVHSRADSVVLQAVRDNTLFEDADGDTSNGSGPGLFCGRTSQGRSRRALLAFDVAATLPAGAVVVEARLELHFASSSDLTPRVLSLHRVVADWGEGASFSTGGSGAPAQTGDATWLHRSYPGSPWSNAGGDFAPEPSAATTVSGQGGESAWSSVLLTADVTAWLDGSEPDFGWLLLGDETGFNTARRCDSRESPTESLRPRLVIHFVVPTPALPASWGGLKIRYR